MNLTNFNNVKETIMEQYKNHQDYQLELKQIVEFPRCRIYRDFIRSLITNKGSVPVPASGSFNPGLSAETELHYLLSSGE